VPERLTFRIPSARRCRPRLGVAIAAVLGGLAVFGAARADTYFGVVDYRNNLSETFQDGGTTSAPAIYTLGGGGSLAVSETLNANGGSAFASAIALEGSTHAATLFRYTITLVGPAGEPVGVNVLANGYAEGSGRSPASGEQLYAANARFLLRAETPIVAEVFARATRQSFAVNALAFFRPNVRYDVDLFAEAWAGGPHGVVPASTAQAFVDPVFIIDPAFASLYQLVGVPTVPPGGGGAIPEPSVWAVLLVGFGCVGAALRRRRHAPA
jgi:hypothetical protein